MLEPLILSLMLTLVNPADPSGQSMYPSGIQDIDSYIFSSPKASKMPLMRLETSFIDSAGVLIEPGIYEGCVSPDGKVIYLLQSNQIKGIIEVSSIKTLDKMTALPSIGYKINENKATITIKYELFEFQGTVDIAY